jgi:hypothetical protein
MRSLSDQQPMTPVQTIDPVPSCIIMSALEGTPRSKGFNAMRNLLLLLSVLALSISAQAQQRSATISSIAPTFGPPGTTVTIRGAGLAGSEAGFRWVRDLATEPAPGVVEFNGVPGDVLFWDDELISVKVPKAASTGPVRVVVANPRAIAIVDVFDVYYSSSLDTPARSREMTTGTERPAGDTQRNSEREPRLRFDNEAPQFFPYYVNPWFSGLSPGERTFLGEQGFANTFLFGNPFSLGRKSSGLFGRGGFGDDRFRDDGFRRGFRGFGFQSPFFGSFQFRGPRHSGIRPFWFRLR